MGTKTDRILRLQQALGKLIYEVETHPTCIDCGHSLSADLPPMHTHGCVVSEARHALFDGLVTS